MLFNNFPLDFVPTLRWTQPPGNPHVAGRHFGARRPGGRWHAGCDLIAPEGSNVYAVADGTVLYAGRMTISYLPAVHVHEVRIEHRGFVVRYMELGHIAHGLARGSQVRAGDVIGTVGRMVNDSMLHFELYGGTVAGEVVQMHNPTQYYYVDPGPYRRRRDLVDPTDELLALSRHLPANP
jgi:murein DD-endopeptidase MepM/ murein hydrolase activator NlpD